MQKYGCIGKKLTHSFSKEIHAKLADYKYELIELSEDEIAPFFTQKEFAAINVTIPYKREVMQYCDVIDDAARAIAEAVGADKLIFLTDTDGILVDSQNQSTRIARMDVARARELIDTGLIAGGMIPKTMNCIHAVEHGVGAVTVLDGCMDHAVLLEAISEKSLGTTIEKKR